jgi:hypothetical protein
LNNNLGFSCMGSSLISKYIPFQLSNFPTAYLGLITQKASNRTTIIGTLRVLTFKLLRTGTVPVFLRVLKPHLLWGGGLSLLTLIDFSFSLIPHPSSLISHPQTYFLSHHHDHHHSHPLCTRRLSSRFPFSSNPCLDYS